jgi:hypothetical protein
MHSQDEILSHSSVCATCGSPTPLLHQQLTEIAMQWKRGALAILVVTVLGLASPAFADQDNAVANEAAQALAAAQNAQHTSDAVILLAPADARCYRRNSAGETEIVCPADIEIVQSK